jgi:hypothetical protein
MDIREQDSVRRALGIITAIVIAAGFAMVAAWFALLVMDERRSAPVASPAASSCRICGVVERVSEIPPAPSQPLEGSLAEGAVTMLAAMGGAAPGRRPARIYETSVMHDDGSVRVLQDTGMPQWKPGDRVKVIKGRVEPDASPRGRTAIPGPQAARGW